MLAHLPLQQLNQFRLHEIEAVGNIQTHKLFPSQGIREALLEFHSVLLLHHEDQLRPFKLFGTQLAVRVRREACGVGLDAGRSEHLLRRGAAEPVSAADEKHTSQDSCLGMETTTASSWRSTRRWLDPYAVAEILTASRFSEVQATPTSIIICSPPASTTLELRGWPMAETSSDGGLERHDSSSAASSL
jgi:hypothetical protein